MPDNEIFISVDVETSGPNPGNYSLLSIGACLVSDPQTQFYIELQPVNDASTEQALQISNLDLEELRRQGLPPSEAMERFAQWVQSVTLDGEEPIFVAFNAAFDWMFVNDYFHRYLKYNPFGHKALDIKAFYMGMLGVPWQETGMVHISGRYLNNQSLSHHALQDALDQAAIFQGILEESKRRTPGG